LLQAKDALVYSALLFPGAGELGVKEARSNADN
jgi:hypothetical protein